MKCSKEAAGAGGGDPEGLSSWGCCGEALTSTRFSPAAACYYGDSPGLPAGLPRPRRKVRKAAEKRAEEPPGARPPGPRCATHLEGHPARVRGATARRSPLALRIRTPSRPPAAEGRPRALPRPVTDRAVPGHAHWPPARRRWHASTRGLIAQLRAPRALPELSALRSGFHVEFSRLHVQDTLYTKVTFHTEFSILCIQHALHSDILHHTHTNY